MEPYVKEKSIIFLNFNKSKVRSVSKCKGVKKLNLVRKIGKVNIPKIEIRHLR